MTIRSNEANPLAAILIYLLGLTISQAGFAAPPGDIVFGDFIVEGEDDTLVMPPPYFAHWQHRIRYRCYVCHEKIFKMARGTNVMNLQLLKQGKFCGECHNGKEAFAIGFNTCNRCHSRIAATRPKP